MSWVDDVLNDKMGDDARGMFDSKRDAVRKVYEAYKSQGLDADEARILASHTFVKRFNQDREVINLQEVLTENYLVELYVEDIGDDDDE